MREHREREPRDRDDMMDDSDDYRGGDRKFVGGGMRNKKCRFCTDSESILDYKNARVMGYYLTEHGKIVPRRISGNCAFHQRRLTSAVKRSRQIALVGYTEIGHY